MRNASLSLVIRLIMPISVQPVQIHLSAPDCLRINGDKHITLYFDLVGKPSLNEYHLYNMYQAHRNRRWSSDTFVCWKGLVHLFP
jgi:hypothetical protein